LKTQLGFQKSPRAWSYGNNAPKKLLGGDFLLSSYPLPIIEASYLPHFTMDQFKTFSQQLNPLAAKLGKQFGQVRQVT
jgi:hypothetical protein